MNRKLRTALIGLGQQGKKRLQAILAPKSYFELVYIVDKNTDVLRQAAERFSLSTIRPSAKSRSATDVYASSDWMDVVESPDVEVVIIATTTNHEEIAVKCLKPRQTHSCGKTAGSRPRLVQTHR